MLHFLEALNNFLLPGYIALVFELNLNLGIHIRPMAGYIRPQDSQLSERNFRPSKDLCQSGLIAQRHRLERLEERISVRAWHDLRLFQERSQIGYGVLLRVDSFESAVVSESDPVPNLRQAQIRVVLTEQ